jgi:hypothetical protein
MLTGTYITNKEKRDIVVTNSTSTTTSSSTRVILKIKKPETTASAPNSANKREIKFNEKKI